MNKKTENILQKTYVWVSLAVFANFLWGSAFPANKKSYELFAIDTGNPFNVLIFAGLRFTIGGIMTLLFYLIFIRKNEDFSYSLKSGKNMALLTAQAVIAVFLQYIFFYIGLGNTTAVKSSVIAASGGFIGVILAHIFFKNDKLEKNKILSILVGIPGVLILTVPAGTKMDFNITGDSFVLISVVCGCLGQIFSKHLTKIFPPFIITGFQLLLGGIMLILTGTLGGGKIYPKSGSAILLLLYLSFISAAAFSIWTSLLKVHRFSRISVFKSLVPVFGTTLSVLLLGESFNLSILTALILIITSLVLASREKKA